MKIKKTILIMIIALLWIIFAAGALLWGYQMGINTPDGEEIISIGNNAVDVKTIAVVNLDEGITEDDKTVNYANELLDFTSENIIGTSLEDARNGVEEGRYAAYVIIPATFSKNINSINETPVESEIQYALHTNLTSDAGLAAMSNVHLLIESLNNNVSYMYVDSILNEFHIAQDSVEEILDNGKVVSEALNGVTPQDISANVNFPSDKRIDYSPETVDYSAYLQNNSQLLEGINQEYSEGYSKSQKAKDNLTTAAKNLEADIVNTNNKLKDANVELDEEGNMVYDPELTELQNNLNSFNQGLDDAVKEIKSTVTDTGTELNTAVGNLADVSDCFNDTVTNYNKGLSKNIDDLNNELTGGAYTSKLSVDNLIYDDSEPNTISIEYSDKTITSYALADEHGEINKKALVQLIKDVVKNGYVEYKSVSKISITNQDAILAKINKSIAPINVDAAYKKIENEEGEEQYEVQEQSIAEQISVISESLKTLQTNLDTFETSEIAGIDVEQTVIDVKGDVVDKLSENAQKITDSIRGEYQEQSEVLARFSTGLSDYDPYAYIDQQAIQKKYTDLNSSTSNLAKAMQQKEANDIEAANNMYTKYSENIAQLREGIDAAVTSSNQAVESGLENAKNVMQTKTARDEDLLKAFSQKLLYTRNGSLGNYRIYQFIVDPFEGQNMTQDVKTSKEEKDTQTTTSVHTTPTSVNRIGYLIPILGVILVLCGIGAVKLTQKSKKDNYNL